jgi:hypothetical protein
MNIKRLASLAGLAATAVLGFSAEANAAAILCSDASKNHMYVNSIFVSSCAGSGVGNIGNGQNDDFLSTPAGDGYSILGAGSFAQFGSIGTFWFDPSYWSLSSDLAAGFKFGTGNKPDEWFVYDLQPNVSGGLWSFVNEYDRGGGLSHVVVYDPTPPTRAPEPTTFVLLGVGFLGLLFTRRARRREVKRN